MYFFSLLITTFMATSLAADDKTVIALGAEYMCHLVDAGLRCWGENEYGELGHMRITDIGDKPGEMGKNLSWVDLGPMGRAIDVVCGAHTTCVLSEDHKIKCWGFGLNGQLGIGRNLRYSVPDNTTLVDLGSNFAPMHLVSTLESACALSTNHEVKCWGANYFGQLGYGNTQDIGSSPDQLGDNLPVVDLGANDTVHVTSLCGGFHNFCALFSNRKIKCWGSNQDGNLGLGDKNHRGDQPGEMGANLPFVNLGDDFEVSQVTCGIFHTCATSIDGKVKCFGQNKHGQLGTKNRVQQGHLPSTLGNQMRAASIGSNFSVVQVAAGTMHTCALSDEAKIKCWGGNGDGESGWGSPESRWQHWLMDDNLPFVDLGDDFVPAQIEARSAFTCAVSIDGRVKCWGANHSGQLGLGDKVHRGNAPGQMGNNLTAIDLRFETMAPTRGPTVEPTSSPTADPTEMPTWDPTPMPSRSPSKAPLSSVPSPSSSASTTTQSPTDSNVVYVAQKGQIGAGSISVIVVMLIVLSVVLLMNLVLLVLCCVKKGVKLQHVVPKSTWWATRRWIQL